MFWKLSIRLSEVKTTMIHNWELEKARRYTNGELKNMIWLYVDCGQPIPGCMSVESLSAILIERGEDGRGYHGAKAISRR